MKNSNNSTDFTSETIGTRLKRLRKEKGFVIVDGVKHRLTQKYIAVDILHYSDEQMYRDCEKDKLVLKLDCLITLADFYGVSVDYLLCRSHYVSCDNEMISQSIGLSDKAIENIRDIIRLDYELNEMAKAYKNLNPNIDYPPRDLIAQLDRVLAHDNIGVILKAINMFMSKGYNIPVVFESIGGVSSWYATDQRPYLDKEYNYISLARSMANSRDKIEVPITDTIIETTALKDIEKALYEIKEGLAN